MSAQYRPQDHRQKADYILGLKGNQETLCEDVVLFVEEQKKRGFSDTTVSTHETVDGGHGRIETRRVTVVHDVTWLQERHDWPGLKGIVAIESKRETDGKISVETRLYITPSTLTAAYLGPIVRDHWAIENGLHWVLDMAFRDDECRIRTDAAPENYATSQTHGAQSGAKEQGQGFNPSQA